MRLDLVEPAKLEALVRELGAYGMTPVFVLDSEMEVSEFKSRFAATRYGALDWPPRARFVSAFETDCWFADDQGSGNGTYPTDRLEVVE